MMPRNIRALAAVALATCAAPTSAVAAGVGDPVGRTVSRVVSNPTVPHVAYLETPGTLALAREDRGVRRYTVPTDCVPAAMASSVVAMECGQPGAALPTILSLDTGRLREVPSEAFSSSSRYVAAVGERWLELEVAHSVDVAGHSDVYRLLIDWRTKRTIDLRRDPFGRRHEIALDRASGARRLCEPLRRHDNADPAYDKTRYAPSHTFGSWNLETRASAQIRRCGSRRLRARFSQRTPISMNATFVAYRVGDRIRLRWLGGRVVRSFEVPGDPQPQFLLTRTAIFFRSSSGSVYARALPPG
jgi:hypothetical protein